LSQTPNLTEGEVIKVKKAPFRYDGNNWKLYYIGVALYEEHGYTGPISDMIVLTNSLRLCKIFCVIHYILCDILLFKYSANYLSKYFL
jgi:hypothetical protein